MADFRTPIGNIPKPVGYLALAAGAGAAIYVYVKKKNAKKAGAAGSAAPDGSSQYGYGTGPSPYGYGAYTYEPYGYGYGPYGLGGYGGGGGGSFGYGFYGAGVPAQVPQQATTNPQWSEAAVSALTQGGQYTATTVLAALGVYLTGGMVTPDQRTIVESAIAAEGYPPVPGANGFPPAINSASPNGGGGGGGGTAKVTVPNVVGKNVGAAYNAMIRAGLVQSPSIAHINTKWIVTSQNPDAGDKVAKGTAYTVKAKAP